MPTDKIIYQEEQYWKGQKYVTEYVDSIHFESIHPITQVQALCLDENGRYVIYQDRDGNYGLPGGTVEDETLEEALLREIAEEVACSVLEYRPLLYLKNTNPPGAMVETTYQVRYMALVRPFAERIGDPAGKSVQRVLVSNASELRALLNWGKKMEIYLAAVSSKRRDFQDGLS